MRILYSFVIMLNIAACQSKKQQNSNSLTVSDSAIPKTQIAANPIKTSDSSITSLRLFYMEEENSRDSYSISDEYILQGNSLRISHKSTGSHSQPEENKVYTLSRENLDKLYKKLKREDLLKDYNKTLDVAKDASTSETSLRIELGSGKSYTLAASGGYKDISKDEVYKSIQSIKYLLESFSKN